MNLIKKLGLMSSFFLVFTITSPVIPAETSRFDATTLTLDIPCVEVLDNNEPTGPEGQSRTYAITLQFDGQFFTLDTASAIEKTDNCTATFDLATRIYTDQVRYRDNIYDVTLTLESGVSFSLDSVSFRERGKSSLWRVSNGTNEVIIGGTIHILKPSDVPPPEIFLEAYAQAEHIVTEVSFDDLYGYQGQYEKYSLMLISDGSTLSSTLSQSTYDALDQYLSANDKDILGYEYIRPQWVSQDVIGTEAENLGYTSGLEGFFYSLTQQDGKINYGLETTTSQILAINNTDAHLTPDEMILGALEFVQSGEMEEALDIQIRAWREGDTTFLNEINELSKAESLADYNTMLTNRNAAWVPQIVDMLDTEELELILVGVYHLVGVDSVLKMLEDLGYSIELYK